MFHMLRHIGAIVSLGMTPIIQVNSRFGASVRLHRELRWTGKSRHASQQMVYCIAKDVSLKYILLTIPFYFILRNNINRKPRFGVWSSSFGWGNKTNVRETWRSLWFCDKCKDWEWWIKTFYTQMQHLFWIEEIGQMRYKFTVWALLLWNGTLFNLEIPLLNLLSVLGSNCWLFYMRNTNHSENKNISFISYES